MSQSIVAAVDVGTANTKAVVAEVGDGGLQVLGVGQVRSQGMREGKVVNVPKVTEAVARALGDAEMMSGVEIRRVYATLSGGFFRSVNRTGMAPVRRGEVTAKEIAEVRRTAIALPLAADEEVLAVVPQGYAVDETTGVIDPRGMAAACLYGRYHIVTGSEQGTANLRRACEALDLAVDGVQIETLVSAEAVLDDDERELGVLVLDIGAGTTSIAVFRDGILLHTGVIPVAGQQLVDDLAHGLKTTEAEAGRLLEGAGCVDERLVQPGESFEIPGLGGRSARRLPREAMVDLLQPRAEEILFAALRNLDEAGIRGDDLASGVVLTGGTSTLEGLPELAADVFGMPARRGAPRDVGGLAKVVQRPGFAAAVGLVRTAGRNGATRGGRTRTGKVSQWWRRFREMADDYL